jgi:sugar phosphate isomerase/epimerase
MIDPNESKRWAGWWGLDRLIKSCHLLDTSVVTLCSGTRNPASMWARHEDNVTVGALYDFKAALQMALVVAKGTRVKLAFEPETSNVMASARKARQLLDVLNSPCLKVVIDPANLFRESDVSRMDQVLDEAFELLGPDIVLAHAKDIPTGGASGSRAAGKGKLDFGRYVRLLKSVGYEGPLVLHGLNEEEVPGAVAFLKEVIGTG